jgi:DNA-binding response OmpR family regulator
LVREARRDHPHLEAIVVTGYAANYSMDDVIKSGASDLIVKPVRLPEFRARIDLAVGRRREKQRLN